MPIYEHTFITFTLNANAIYTDNIIKIDRVQNKD